MTAPLPAGPPEGPAGPPARPPRPGTPDPALSTWGFGDVGIGFVAAYGLSLVVGAIAYGVAGWRTQSEVPLWGQVLFGQVPLWAGYLGVVVLAGRTKGRGVGADFGLSMRWWDAPVGVLVGLLMQGPVVWLLYWPLIQSGLVDGDDLSAPARDLSDRASGTAGWVVLTLMVVVCAPVVEELFFRGLVLRSCQKRGLPDWGAVVASAALFGAVHFQPLQFLGLFALGLVLATLTVRTGRLGPAIWTHVGFNALTVVTLYLSP